MSTWTVVRAPAPEDLDDPEAWALHGAADVSLAVDRELYGHDDLAYTAQYLLAGLREQEYSTRVRLVAVPADPPAGAPTGIGVARPASAAAGVGTVSPAGAAAGGGFELPAGVAAGARTEVPAGVTAGRSTEASAGTAVEMPAGERADVPGGGSSATAPGEHPRAEDVVGTVMVQLPRRGNTHLAYLELLVHPEHRRAGVGTVLLDAAEQVALEAGRTTLVLSSDHAGEPPAGAAGVLEAPTGSGRIRADDPGAIMARRRGYVLEQAERYSVLELPVEDVVLDDLHADALARAGEDYRLVAWTDRTPDEWVEHVAVLETRMSTDAPMAGLAIEEDPWDADRVRTSERDIVAAGHGFLLVAAEHVPSGDLAAFTMVEYPVDEPGIVYQEDTLVLREHRGRRLGMLVKADLLRRLRTVRPDARRIHTWNAEENRFMLDINEALGFRPAGVSGMWQKVVG